MKTVADSGNRKIVLEKDIAGGGEARIWTVARQPDLIAKLYHQPTTEHKAKVAAMIAAPPVQPSTHTAVAWPLDMINDHGKFAGFLMPNIKESVLIFQFYNPASRSKMPERFTWEHMHRVAYNMAVAVNSIHSAGHVIGDLNESNILVDRAKGFVTLIDTDSFQVTDKHGGVHRCGVGKPEFTPPELQGVNFKNMDRLKEHDLFGTGVMLFYLLMEGVHPFSGVLKNSTKSVGRVDLHCIENGVFPFLKNTKATPPPNAPSLNNLHPDVRKAFIRCFVDGHKKASLRPSAGEWINILSKAETSLQTCGYDLNHVYSGHLKSCPWCEAARPRAVTSTGIGCQKPFKMSPSSSGTGKRKTVTSSRIKNYSKPSVLLIPQWFMACCLGWGLAGTVVFGIFENNPISWLVFGIVGGAAQWLVLNSTVSALWVFISSFQWILFGTARTAINEKIKATLLELEHIFAKYHTGADMLQSPHLKNAICMGLIGLVGGILHWFLLRKKAKYAYLWILACAAGSAAGLVLSNMTVGTYQYQILDFLGAATNRNMNKGVYWTTFGAGYAVITGGVIWRLVRNPKP